MPGTRLFEYVVDSDAVMKEFGVQVTVTWVTSPSVTVMPDAAPLTTGSTVETY